MKKYILFTVLVALGLSSCKDDKGMFPGELEVTPFDVALDSIATEFKVGELINFNFQGNADTIYFYSGEFGKDYNYIDGRAYPAESVRMTIRTQAKYGTQEDQFSILLSEDFNGDYSNAGINAATWIEITDRFELSSEKEVDGTFEGVSVTSGPIDIGDLVEEGKTYHIAVRNKVEPASVAGDPVQWVFYNTFKILGDYTSASGEIESGNLITFADAEWEVIRNGIDNEGRSVVLSESSISFFRNSSSIPGLPENPLDNWAVTRPFTDSVYLRGDRGTIIKAISALPREEYGYAYMEPGEYDITFQGINQNKTESIARLKVKVVE